MFCRPFLFSAGGRKSFVRRIISEKSSETLPLLESEHGGFPIISLNGIEDSLLALISSLPSIESSLTSAPKRQLLNVLARIICDLRLNC